MVKIQFGNFFVYISCSFFVLSSDIVSSTKDETNKNLSIKQRADWLGRWWFQSLFVFNLREMINGSTVLNMTQPGSLFNMEARNHEVGKENHLQHLGMFLSIGRLVCVVYSLFHRSFLMSDTGVKILLLKRAPAKFLAC